MGSKAFDPASLDSVADPSDFPPPNTAPGLRDLDTALRCPICGEHFDAPVSIGCGHSFCSMCIRQYLPSTENCPSCRKPTSTAQMRLNPMLSMAVEAWKAARPHVLELTEEQQRAQENSAERSSSPSEGRPIKRRKINESEDAPGPSRLTVNSSRTPTKNPTGTGRGNAGSDTDVVECPVCEKDVYAERINDHIDGNCKTGLAGRSQTQAKTVTGKRQGRTNQGVQWQMFLGKMTNRMKEEDEPVEENADTIPSASYDMLSGKRLREMLAEYELPTSGEKPILVERHKHWAQLWNANLDRLVKHRKGRIGLRAELRAWEEHHTIGRKGKGAEVRDVNAYEKANNTQFKELIQKAKASREQSGAAAPSGSTSTSATLISAPSSSAAPPSCVDSPTSPSKAPSQSPHWPPSVPKATLRSRPASPPSSSSLDSKATAKGISPGGPTSTLDHQATPRACARTSLSSPPPSARPLMSTPTLMTTSTPSRSGNLKRFREDCSGPASSGSVIILDSD